MPGRKFRLVDWGRNQRTGSAGADACLWRIAGVANSTGRCFMSDASIARLCGSGERTITRYLAILRSAGLISSHYENGRRVIIFNCSEARHLGCLRPPNQRSGVSQSGGQNLIRRILPADLQAEYVGLGSIEGAAERLAAQADFRRRHVDFFGEGQASGRGGSQTSPPASGHRRGAKNLLKAKNERGVR